MSGGTALGGGGESDDRSTRCEERLAGAVASGRVSQARAARALERLERLVHRLVAKTFPSR